MKIQKRYFIILLFIIISTLLSTINSIAVSPDQLVCATGNVTDGDLNSVIDASDGDTLYVVAESVGWGQRRVDLHFYFFSPYTYATSISIIFWIHNVLGGDNVEIHVKYYGDSQWTELGEINQGSPTIDIKNGYIVAVRVYKNRYFWDNFDVEIDYLEVNPA